MSTLDHNDGHVHNLLDSLTRRDLLRGTASLAAMGTVGSLLAACGSTSGPTTGAAASSSSTSSGPARRGGTLSLALTDTEASETLESQKKVQEEAEESLRLAKARADAGTGTQLDVLTAQTSLTQARSTQVQALHDYDVARARLERAMGINIMQTSK